ncbi:hypothetical protein Q1695_002427 [Nippostrongylus brasiliensis]|nr:hypothetical protein Q1695_002427 [Nippostrongylus brasiliensis]
MNAFVQVQAVRLRSKNHLAKKPSAATSGGDILDDDYDYEQFCPRRVDAFVTVHRDSFLFAGGDVYVIRKDRINSLEYIGEVFLKGPASVDAALYDKNRKIVVLIKGRTSDGRFGIYDEFLNHSLMVANVSDYFTIRLNRKQTAKWRMELLIRKATEDGPGDDDYNYEDYCPERVDAFCSVNNTWYLFVDDDVYVIQNGTIDSLEYIEDIFPGGPTAVNAALYDEDKQRLLLIKNRTVYAFKQETSGEFILDKKFPKAITASITFEPVGAMRWYDKRQVLLSKDGRFALYDEYWNKSLMTGRIEDHFEGLPKDVRGISTWIAGEACVFKSTHALIYKHKNGQYILSQETPVAKFLKCK